MNTNARKKRLFLLSLAIFLLMLACSTTTPPEIDTNGGEACGQLVLTCENKDYTLGQRAKDLSQNVKGNIRYFKWYDCQDDEKMQSSCNAACTVEIR